MTSAPILPSYLGLPFRILVSPFVPFDPETRTTDIIMFNSKNLGALIVAEEPHVKSWEDGQYNILNISIEDVRHWHEPAGPAVAVAKNGTVRPKSSPGRLALRSTRSRRPSASKSPRACTRTPEVLPQELTRTGRRGVFSVSQCFCRVKRRVPMVSGSAPALFARFGAGESCFSSA